MENPIQFTNSSSKQINTTLKNTGGLGTVATRADIIEKLFNTFLIEKHGNDIRLLFHVVLIVVKTDHHCLHLQFFHKLLSIQFVFRFYL